MIPALQPNDLIYICSPAKAIEQEHLEFAKVYFESQGFRVKISTNAAGRYNYFSGSIDERLADFQVGLNNPDVKAIICARGGYGCIHLIDKLDWTGFQKRPKWICGFSDVTNFHLELSSMGMPSLHSSMPLNYKTNTKESLESLTKSLKCETHSLRGMKNFYNKIGDVEGELIGGNLSILFALLSRHGNEVYRDKILFIEDLGEHLYHLDRMLYAFANAGITEVIKGLVVGSFTNMKDTPNPFGKGVEEIILDHFGIDGLPIGFGFNVGHQKANETVVIGQEYRLLFEGKIPVLSPVDTQVLS
jgi:muramoyltetrapeptide carboxypeptidase